MVIPKQPLGIAFLSTRAFESVQSTTPGVSQWVVAGHSLGGTVAAMEAQDHGAAADAGHPVVGLLLHASYPAGDLSSMAGVSVLSIYGTNDGLATPDDIEASRANLPPSAEFVAGRGRRPRLLRRLRPQPGDGEPTISHDEARTQISNASVGFVTELAAAETVAP